MGSVRGPFSNLKTRDGLFSSMSLMSREGIRRLASSIASCIHPNNEAT